MKKWLLLTVLVVGCLAALLLDGRIASLAGLTAPGRGREMDPAERLALAEIASEIGRKPVGGEREERALPAALADGVPRDAAELAALVDRLRALGHDELLRLSNAEYEFQESALIELLQGLEGDWVVTALGALAVREADPLLRAILVEGLVGGVSFARLDDPHLLPVLESLVVRMSAASDDPYRVAHGLASTTFMACMRGQQAYPDWMAAHLATSDNAALLSSGYLYMGQMPGGEATLKALLTTHASADGRFGVLEGLRAAGSAGRIAPEEITALGLEALARETSERNRLLLYEMMVSTGGEAGLGAVEEIVRTAPPSELRQTIQLSAMKAEPARALALAQQVLAERELDAETLQAVYSALGSIETGEGEAMLLALAQDADQDPEQRLAGLRGLWNRPPIGELGAELQTLFETSDEPELRVEALRMLTSGETPPDGLDLRAIGVLDDDPAIRSEAVMLAALEAGADSRAWLEERLHQDDSFDVKAAALGGLVMHAHYGGGGEEVLGYLVRARKLAFDDDTRAMIAEGERMVREHDPRRLELELVAEAEFWSTMTRYTSGAAQRGFQRQARVLERMVGTLRAAQR